MTDVTFGVRRGLLLHQVLLTIAVATSLWLTWNHGKSWALRPDFPSSKQISKASSLTSSSSSSSSLLLPPSDWTLEQPDSKAIRRWGCQRTETPFINVHIGKAGGGSVQARIAASGLGYTTRTSATNENDDDDGHDSDDSVDIENAYYPVNNQSKARACFHCFARHLTSLERSMGGTEPCHATTPLGQAIACPEMMNILKSKIKKHQLDCQPDSEHCHVVYSAHNFLGAEFHWLPAPYLKKWWSERWQRQLERGKKKNEENLIAPLWDKLDPDHIWCDSFQVSRPQDVKSYLDLYDSCSIPLHREVDSKAVQAMQGTLSTNFVVSSWAPLYASLPVLRVTVLREPFSWLLSKFFWHRKRRRQRENGSTVSCDNFDDMVMDKDKHQLPRPQVLGMNVVDEPGWLTRLSLGYIFYLCGEDCMVRYATGNANLDDLELQAEGNLRQSFAVVGLLDDVDTFYQMVRARVQYMDTSLNPHIQGARHSTGNSAEIDYCRAKFKNLSFQQKMLDLSPELRALHRLYQVGVEVNQFQLQELKKCHPKSFSPK